LGRYVGISKVLSWDDDPLRKVRRSHECTRRVTVKSMKDLAFSSLSPLLLLPVDATMLTSSSSAQGEIKLRRGCEFVYGGNALCDKPGNLRPFAFISRLRRMGHDVTPLEQSHTCTPCIPRHATVWHSTAAADSNITLESKTGRRHSLRRGIAGSQEEVSGPRALDHGRPRLQPAVV
jgi:hypothetical protein